MLTHKQLELLDAWRSSLNSELAISDIMSYAGKRSKPWAFLALKEMKENEILISRRVGNMDLYKLNFSHPSLIYILQYIDASIALKYPALKQVSKILKTQLKDFIVLFSTGKKLKLTILVESKTSIKLEGFDYKIKTYEDFINEGKTFQRVFMNPEKYYQLVKEVIVREIS